MQSDALRGGTTKERVVIMKKVIRGRLYDTEKAVLIGEFFDERKNQDDLDFYTEELYKKRTGEYFLYGRGNAGSKYSQWRGSTASGSECISPLSFSQARDWAEEYLNADDFIREFGDPERNDDKIVVSLNLKKGNAEKLRRLAALEDKPMSSIIDEMIEKSEI